MKVNLDTKIVNANGQPLKGNENTDLTVREALTNLLVPYNAPWKSRFVHYSAGIKIGDSSVTEVELTTKELEIVKGAVEANEFETPKGIVPIYKGTWIRGQISRALGETEESDDKSS